MTKYILTILAVLIILSCTEETTTESKIQENPTVKIITPADNSAAIDSVLIEIEATDNKGVVLVEIYIDNNLHKDFTIPPYKYNWVFNNQVDSSNHTIYAKAYDGDNNVTSSNVITVLIQHLITSQIIGINHVSGNEISIYWDDNNTAETGYELERSINDGVFQLLAQLAKNSIFYNDNTLNKENKYKYRLFTLSDTFQIISDTINVVYQDNIYLPVDTLIGHQKNPTFAVFNDDGNFLATGGNSGEVIIWDFQNRTLYNSLQSSDPSINYNQVNWMDFSPGRDEIAISLDDGRYLSIYNYNTGEEKIHIDGNSFPLKQYNFHCIIYGSSGDFLYALSNDALLVMDAINANLLFESESHESRLERVLGYNSNYLISSIEFSGDILVWDLNNLRIINRIEAHSAISAFIYPNEYTLCYGRGGASGGSLIYWDLNSDIMSEIFSIPTEHGVSVMDLNSVHNLLAVRNHPTNIIEFVDLITGSKYYEIEFESHYPYILLFSNDGEWLISGANDRNIILSERDDMWIKIE